MGSWSPDSKTHVATMTQGDFKANEKSITIKSPTAIKIELTQTDGTKTVLKESIKLLEGEIIDATILSKNSLIKFLQEQVKDAKEKGVLFSVHLKATMMKVSDPVIFGHVVKVFFADVFKKHSATFKKIDINANDGLEILLKKIKSLPDSERKQIESDIENTINPSGPALGPCVQFLTKWGNQLTRTKRYHY